MPTNFKSRVLMQMIIALLFGTQFSLEVFSQAAPPTNIEGSELRAWFKANWYDNFHNDLGYNGARSAMYGYIDKADDGEVYGVYSGFHQTAATVTFLNPINAEHTVPQSFFNQNLPMRSDIHHLYPTHMNVNSARGSDPFDEIVDAQTNTWYIGNTSLQTSSSIPTSNIDAYSEDTSNEFEPREGHKGDLARAIFYFYTMYENNNAVTRPIADVGDINVLYQWHLDDLPDAWEKQRNDRVEERQGNRNPYIDFPDALAKAWGFEPANPGLANVSFERSSETIEPTSNYAITLVTDNPAEADLLVSIGIGASNNITYGTEGFVTNPVAVSGSIDIVIPKGDSRISLLVDFAQATVNSSLTKTISFSIEDDSNYTIGTNGSFELTMNGSLVTALHPPEITHFNIYPNPSTGELHLEGFDGNDQLVLFDTQGRLIKIKAPITRSLDLSELPKGLYYLGTISNSSVRFLKLILE